jgi:hypothetical protein
MSLNALTVDQIDGLNKTAERIWLYTYLETHQTLEDCTGIHEPEEEEERWDSRLPVPEAEVLGMHVDVAKSTFGKATLKRPPPPIRVELAPETHMTMIISFEYDNRHLE